MALVIAPLLAGAASPAASSITISAFLLSSETGRLSPDAMIHPDLLGNAVAGAASAHAALVRVKVAVGHGAPLPSGARVRLVARVSGARAIVGGAEGETGRVVLDRTVRLGPASASGDAYAGFCHARPPIRPPSTSRWACWARSPRAPPRALRPDVNARRHGLRIWRTPRVISRTQTTRWRPRTSPGSGESSTSRSCAGSAVGVP